MSSQGYFKSIKIYIKLYSVITAIIIFFLSHREPLSVMYLRERGHPISDAIQASVQPWCCSILNQDWLKKAVSRDS